MYAEYIYTKNVMPTHPFLLHLNYNNFILLRPESIHTWMDECFL